MAVEGSSARGTWWRSATARAGCAAAGWSNYDARACRALLGRHSEEIEDVLGWRGYDALVTRDNLVLGAAEVPS